MNESPSIAARYDECPPSAPRWAVHRRTCVHGVALDLKIGQYVKGARHTIHAIWAGPMPADHDEDELVALERARQLAALAFAASLGIHAAEVLP